MRQPYGYRIHIQSFQPGLCSALTSGAFYHYATALRCKHVVVGTRFCASAPRPDAGRALLDRRSLPREPTAFNCDPAKKSTLESYATVPTMRRRVA